MIYNPQFLGLILGVILLFGSMIIPALMQSGVASISRVSSSTGEGIKIFTLIVGDKTYPINYTIVGGEISRIAAQSTGLVINFTLPASAGAAADPVTSTTRILLTIDLPRALIDSIDAQQGGADKPFAVLSGNGQVIDTVMETKKNATSRTLVISFNNSPNNLNSLLIQGTKIALPPAQPLPQTTTTPSPGGTTPPSPPTTPTIPPAPPAPPTTPTTPPAPPTTPTTPPAPPTTPTTPPAPPTTPTTPPAPPTTPTTPPAPPTTPTTPPAPPTTPTTPPAPPTTPTTPPAPPTTPTTPPAPPTTPTTPPAPPDALDSDKDGFTDARDNCDSECEPRSKRY